MSLNRHQDFLEFFFVFLVISLELFHYIFIIIYYYIINAFSKIDHSFEFYLWNVWMQTSEKDILVFYLMFRLSANETNQFKIIVLNTNETKPNETEKKYLFSYFLARTFLFLAINVFNQNNLIFNCRKK